jgi:2-dehydropantoate 2-reductase
MRVLVYGAGAIGAYVGGSLAHAGHSVGILARPASAEALRARGLRLHLETGLVVTTKPAVFTSPAEALAGLRPDLVVFALKSFDTAAALAELSAATKRPPPLLCLQNGVDNEAEIARAFGPACVIAGTVTSAVSRPGPGEISVERKRGVGLASGHPLSADAYAALNEAGLNARGYSSAAAMKWSKLLTNLVGNATSAILDLPVAEIFRDPRLFRVELRMLLECLAVMRAERASRCARWRWAPVCPPHWLNAC